LKKFPKKILIFVFILILVIYLRFYLSFSGFGNYIKLVKKPRRNILNQNKLIFVSNLLGLIGSIIPYTTCLIKASVLKIVFNEEDELKVIIGIKNNSDGIFKSHAWVTFNNKIILNNDLEIDSYRVIYRI
tara:strand:+ start:2129 stop:2518 length:390 start_codon:yes stop_codon:yes gene_type:complete